MALSPIDFQCFPRMDEYLRRMVWRYYYESPRIHVIHEAGAPEIDPEVIELTCSSFDATHNIPVATFHHHDINRESRAVALLVQRLHGRERLRNMLQPLPTPSIFHREWPTQPTEWKSKSRSRRQHQQEHGGVMMPPVDVDWANDLIYVCSPASGLPFASFWRGHGDWASKIQRLALAQPFETPTTAMARPRPTIPRDDVEPSTFRFNANTLGQMFDVFTGLKEILIVSLPPSIPVASSLADQSMAANDDDNDDHDDHDDNDNDDHVNDDNDIKRHEWGFITFSDYLRQKHGVENRRFSRNTTDTTRIFLSVEQQRPEGCNVKVRKCVDLDGRQLANGKYRRRSRGWLPKHRMNPVVDGNEFTFVVSGPE